MGEQAFAHRLTVSKRRLEEDGKLDVVFVAESLLCVR
jgi:hypothetical protein